MANVLIIATPQEGRRLTSQLASERYETSLASDLEEAQGCLQARTPDLILLDMSADLGDKEQVREWLAQAKAKHPVPVMALVPEDRLRDAEAPWIDDFSSLPCSPPEFMTRIRRLLKGGAGAEGEDLIRSGNLSLDLAKYELCVGETPVELTFKEFELLKFLVAHPGRVYTRESLLSHVWGYDYYGGTRTVDVHIRRLRSKIEDANHTYIDTVRNVGYIFKA
ncbi:MAG: response regulator transcription factor [Dehalococcoidia bacterium]